MAKASPFIIGLLLITSASGAREQTEPTPEGWHRTTSFESILRSFQHRHFITKGEYTQFPPAPGKPPPEHFPPDGYYGSLLETYGLKNHTASPLPTIVNHMFRLLFEDSTNLYWIKSISHRFVTAEAFDSLLAGEISPRTIYSRTVGESVPPPKDGHRHARSTLPAETKIDMVAERLSNLRYYLKPLPASQVVIKSSGPISSTSYRRTAQQAIDVAKSRWENSAETSIGLHPSRYHTSYFSKENVNYAKSLAKYYAFTRSYRITYQIDLTEISGTAYAFRCVRIAPGTANPPLGQAEIKALEDRFGGVPPDGRYHHFATRPAGSLVSFPWIGTGTPFSGVDERQSIDFRITTDGKHREDYPDGNTDYGPFVIIDLGADPDQMLDNPDACEFCASGTCLAGTAEFANNSVDASFSLGSGIHGESQGKLCLKLPVPLPGSYTPSMLEVRGGDQFGSLTNTQTENLSQFYGPDTVVDITGVTPNGYTLEFRARDAQWGTDATTGLLRRSGTTPTVATISIRNPDPTGQTYNGLKITHTDASATTETLYRYDPGSAGWHLITGNGERSESLYSTRDGETETASRTTRDQNQTTISQSVVKTKLFGWGSEVTETTLGTGASAKTTSYSYYSDRAADGTAYGNLCQVSSSDGTWTRYHYEPGFGRLAVQITGLGNVPPPPAAEANDPDDPDDAIDETRCHLIRYTHPWQPAAAAPDTLTTIETRYGHEVSRTYETRTWGKTVRQQCLAAGAPFAPGTNPTTTTTYHLDSKYAGMPKKVVHPNGTVSLFTYSQDAAGNKLRTVSNGVPDDAGTGITEGTTTVTTNNLQGQSIRTVVTDAASSLVIQDDHSTPEQLDAFGRPTSVSHLGGLESSITYDCCGISSQTDRFGATTEYAEDVPVAFTNPLTQQPMLLTAETSSSPAAGGKITVATARDGLTEYSLRIGTDGTTTVKSITATDTTGRTVRRTVATGNSNGYAETTIAETTNAAGNRVVTTTTPDRATMIETYQLDGSLSSVTGTSAHPHRFEYGVTSPGLRYSKQIFLHADLRDSAEWVKTTTGMLGETLRIDRSSESAPGGVSTTTYSYDPIGRLVAETDADGVTVLYAYDTLGRRDTVALDRNRNGKIDYDGSDRIEKTQLSFARQNPREPTSDIVAQTTKLVWGTAGLDTPETASLSAVAANNLASWLHVGAQTSHRSLSYDGTSWIETTLRPDHSYIQRTYVAGTGMTVVDSETLFDKSDTPIVSTSNHYDAHGRLTGSTDTRNNRPGTAFTYYDSDQIFTTTTPAPGGPQTTTYTYDDRGRRDLVTLPDSGVIDYDYNTYGKLAEVSGARSYHIAYEYDHRGRISKMNTRHGSTHQATTEWHYHPLSGLLAKKIAPGGDPLSGANTHSYQQTPAGRLHKRTNGRATVATFTYLESGELGSITYDDRTTPANTFTYQRSGNLATRSDASGDHIYTPDSQGAYAGNQTIAGPLDKTSITPDYDQLGRRTGLTLTAGNQTIAVSYTYDALSRLDTVSQGPAKATYIPRPDSLKFQGLDFEHDGTHVLSQRIQHDSLNRITSTATTTRTTAPNPLFATTYTYNNGGQRTRATRENGSHWNYHYDAFGHLTDATKFPTSAGSEALGGFAFDYRYDRMGNRISSSTAGLGLPGPGSNDSPLTRYSPAIGDSSQVASVLTPGIISVAGTADPEASVTVAVNSATAQQAARHGAHFHHAAEVDNSTSATRVKVAVRAELPDGSDTATTAHLTPAASTTISYDDDGNLTSDGYRTYSWDAENRLVKVETIPSAVPIGASEYKTEMAYDAIGRRFQKTESQKISGSWIISSNTRYLYDGWNLIAEIDGTTATPILKRSYMWGTDLSGTEQGAGGTGGLLAVTTHTGPTPGTHATAYDANGNITTLVDTSTAEPSATYQYDPYGNLLQATGPAAQINPFRFSTKYHDETTGLIYYGLRYYDPNHGRWISRDPIGEDGGTNLYSFVGNDPINATDLLGLVLFSFDGTGNDRKKDHWDAKGDEKTPTNVAVMTSLYNGTRYYVHGVGTRTDVTLGKFHGYGTKERLETQFRRFCVYNKVKPSDPIDIIGFSRGAASARIFSNKLLNTSRSVLIRFLGLFDTVSQMGAPNRFNYQFGYNLDVSESIGLISHAVAKNEYRSLFPLTSISKSAYYQNIALPHLLGVAGVNAFDPDEYVEIKGSNFIEKPFIGAHSDIGGGYQEGRNMSALYWMVQQGQSVGAPFRHPQTYRYYSKIKWITKPTNSRFIIDTFQGDRAIFPGNR